MKNGNSSLLQKIVAILSVPFLSLAMVSICYATAAKGEKSTFWVIWNNGWRIVNFSIMVYFVVKWLREPVSNFLKSYRNLVKTEIETADMAEQKAQKEYEDAKKQLDRLEDEIEKLMDYAVARGKKHKEKIIESAKAEARGIIERARASALLMVQDARKKLVEELAETVIKTAEKRIASSINEQDQDRLITRYIESIEKTPERLRA